MAAIGYEGAPSETYAGTRRPNIQSAASGLQSPQGGFPGGTAGPNPAVTRPSPSMPGNYYGSQPNYGNWGGQTPGYGVPGFAGGSYDPRTGQWAGHGGYSLPSPGQYTPTYGQAQAASNGQSGQTANGWASDPAYAGIDPRLIQVFQMAGKTPTGPGSGNTDIAYWNNKLAQPGADQNYYLGRLTQDFAGNGPDSAGGGFAPESSDQGGSFDMGSFLNSFMTMLAPMFSQMQQPQQQAPQAPSQLTDPSFWQGILGAMQPQPQAPTTPYFGGAQSGYYSNGYSPYGSYGYPQMQYPSAQNMARVFAGYPY